MYNIRKIMAILTAITSMTVSSSMYLKTSAANQPLSDETIHFYEEWKEKYLVRNEYAADTQYYVWYSGESYAENQYTTEVTVSEAHGYGMLITASMAGYDKDAKEIFDGMYRYYKDHPSEIGPNLMAWQQSDTGASIINSSGADAATDGDMDIAYALLMADTIWGSNGDINYKQAAINVINDIMEYEVNQKDWILMLGDWVDEGDTVYYTSTRASDFMVQYMPVFAEAANDERWMNVYESTYRIINSITEEYGTGILPDFIVKDQATGKFIPSPANFLESEYDGYYYYNSCRTPWRISMDYLINGNEDAYAFANALNTFIINSTSGNPSRIVAGYKPDGTPIEDYDDLCFTAPFLVAASCGEDIQWHNKLRDTVVNYGDDVYFGDTIKMLCLIVDDGSWIVPSFEPSPVIGDVNADDAFNIADIVMMQRYILNIAELQDWDAGDLNKDGKVNGYDLACMKRIILSEK